MPEVPYKLQRLAAALALVILSPLLFLAAMTIRVVDGSPTLFKQERLGRDRKKFQILKFRTMVNDADLLLRTNPTASRLTRTGRFLRKTSIDELPQLFNIVRGEMAGIGPRAMLPEVGRNLPPQFEERFVVLPGLTGLAQVRGRNDLPWSARLTADVDYVRNRSTRLDLAIVLRTFVVLVRGSGFQADRNTAQVDDLGLLSGADD
ncbi:MAG: sugar transferase [Nocardioides sp.]|nr:sugar transferase [Nocardioides sp.]